MKKNQLKLGVMLSYINMAAQNIIAIVYTPIMLRLLGQSEYGLYQLVYSIVSYLGLLSFGFGSAYIRFFSRYKVKNDYKRIEILNGMFMSLFILIGIITLLVGNILIFDIENIFSKSLTIDEIEIAKILMSLMVINLAISFPSSVFESYIMAHECYFFQRLISLFQTILNPFLTLPLLLLGYGSISMVVISTLLTIIKIFGNAWYCLKMLNMHFNFMKIEVSLFKEIGTFSFFIFINMIVDQINWSVDKFILGIYGGTNIVAVYAIGGQINNMYTSLSSSISSVFIPRVNRIVETSKNKNSDLTSLLTKVGRIQFIVLSLVLGGFLLLGQYFIKIWAGNGYENAYVVALLLIIPVTIPLIQNLGIEIQRAKNMHKFRSLVYLCIAIGNVIISIPLSKLYGEIGAAMGTSFTLIVGNIIIMNWYYHFKVKLDMKYFWLNIFKLFPSILFSYIIGFVLSLIINIHSFFTFLLVGVMYFIIYLACLLFFGMNKSEKEIVKESLKKVLRRP